MRHRRAVRTRTPLTVIGEAVSTSGAAPLRRSAVIAASGGLIVTMGLPAVASSLLPTDAPVDAAATQTVTTEDEGEKTRAADMEAAKERAERRTVAKLVHDIAGNPFRPWQHVPAWLGGGVIQPDGEQVRLTETAHTLARVIDAGRHHDRLPILADALEEAGITDAELLAHCRADATHHPGCWAVELALGRT